MSISRRSILTKIPIALASANLLKATSVFEKVESIPHATHFGPFIAKVQNGVIKDIVPQKSDYNPTMMLKAMVDRVYSDSRVKYPCVRKSFLENKKNHKELRGREELVRVSWDVALDLAAKKLKEIPKENIYNASYGGWGHAGSLHRCHHLAWRFFNTTLGGAIGTDGEYGNGAAARINPMIVGDMEVYSQQTTHEEMIKNCKVYVMWGADLFKCNRIDYFVPNHVNDSYYPKYKRAGIQFISIDPIYTETAQAFNAEWIPIRPNTDVALMLGMMHYLYTSNQYDKAFIAKYTDGFDKFLPYLLGESDNAPKTLEWASQITGVNAEKIKELADLFVSKRTFLAGNWAMQRAQYGEQPDWALIVLASMIGQVGLSGGGFGFSMHYGGNAQASSGARIVPMIPQGHNSVKSVIPASRISEAVLNPDKEIDFMGKKLKLPKIKMIYNCGADLLGHEADTNELIRALRTLDCVIVHEPWWTPTAKFADIVFASTSTMERDDITFGGSYSKNVVYAMRKVVEPVYESKDDYEIFRQLALRIGGNETEQKFTESKSYMEWIKSLYEKSDGPTLKSFDQFWRDGFVEFEIPENARKFVRHAKFRQDPINNKLDTESGKIQIFSQKCADFKLADFKGHPTWFEPAEWLGSKMAETYPFHLISPHPKYRVNSQLDNTWVRNVYKIQGREPVMINELDANKLGIRHGEIVEVFNARGRLLAGAFVTKNIRQGVLSIQKGAWYDPEDVRVRNPRCNGGHVNTLTSLRPTSSMTQAISTNTALVNIRRLRKYELVKPYHSISTPSIIGA
ncbi:molybdopterin guanine dinucleotide-containing S/N-oxide reductase [Helicobacter pylori]|uniref:molybdopterin guanine dinucleotide-containing S/N-oxide reductase n=1 Tax=Helicobacter pylori TaxID=210 RepID=UPI001F1184D9|nr:molybdopterin guanine dinucleotide-containing S/N-oxide reductase [Helicobacter pylori]MCH4601310.1 molybdopterin guanine dinucleotide-containing S/N-oxide reductase [Helicobacter pylori]MCH4608574.1 molybdopterin guanine dinucleotide-containing S/N-oxide reductase [Helicobacter pylori]